MPSYDKDNLPVPISEMALHRKTALTAAWREVPGRSGHRPDHPRGAAMTPQLPVPARQASAASGPARTRARPGGWCAAVPHGGSGPIKRPGRRASATPVGRKGSGGQGLT